MTARALLKMGTPFRIVIEPQEFAEYSAVIDPKLILQLPFSNLGKGSIPARNWVWQHSIDEGHRRHWIMDDNIQTFYRFNRNSIVQVSDGTIFHVMEQFADRYLNMPMCGPNYEMFVMRRNAKIPPYTANTRIYSCILLSNEPEHHLKWRGRYNEDTDLSLRFLKQGHCTALFNAFLSKKTATMVMKGGNTDQLYQQDQQFDGRLEMARSLERQHPDVTTVTRKWGRWQHHVDYRPFKGNRLLRRPDVEQQTGVENFGMRKTKRKQG